MIIYYELKVQLCTIVLFLFQQMQCATTKNLVTFDPDSDAFILGNALVADTIINQEIVAHMLIKRTNDQRQEIKKAYYKRYKEDLVIEIDIQFSGEFQEILDSLMVPKRKFYARELHRAVSGLGTDERAICEILGTMNNSQILEVSRVYKTVYGTTLREDLIDDTSGNFQYFLMALCDAYRDPDGPINYQSANEDAHTLYEAIYSNQLIEETFIAIFTTRSFSQLRTIFSAYQNLTNVDIRKSIRTRIYGDVYYGITAIVETATSKSDYYATLLEETMKGLGTDNKKLTRIVVGRYDIDLKDIKKSYQRLYGMSLIDRIDEDTSGQFSYLLRYLVKNC